MRGVTENPLCPKGSDGFFYARASGSSDLIRHRNVVLPILKVIDGKSLHYGFATLHTYLICRLFWDVGVHCVKYLGCSLSN